MLWYGKHECFVMHIFVCVCLVCILWQFSMLHYDLQFVNTGRLCKRPPYGRGILQSMSHDYLIGSVLLFVEVCVRVQRYSESVDGMQDLGLK